MEAAVASHSAALAAEQSRLAEATESHVSELDAVRARL
eukprot:COSAG04_NODE_34180_length_115_cov_8161.062500_1_plen_37_part_11